MYINKKGLGCLIPTTVIIQSKMVLPSHSGHIETVEIIREKTFVCQKYLTVDTLQFV